MMKTDKGHFVAVWLDDDHHDQFRKLQAYLKRTRPDTKPTNSSVVRYAITRALEQKGKEGFANGDGP